MTVADQSIYIKSTRAQLRKILSELPATMRQSGRVQSATLGLAGRALLTRIRAAYTVKAAGGTDDAGEKWPPLAPATLAHRRSRKPPNKGTEILRDRDLLYESLSPDSPNSEQVFRISAGEVILGTNRKWAGVHHRGSRNGRIPQRRLWPPVSKWPARWWQSITNEVKAGILHLVTSLLKGNA